MAARDPFSAEIAAMLAPILAPARERAELLIEELASRHEEFSPFAPRGVADAVRRARKTLSDEEIRAGALALLARLARDFSTRETVT